MLRLGALAPLGLSLPTMLASQASASPQRSSTFGSAKRCLLMFMWGGPAHQDLWDLKPNAPANVRGEFSPIATNVRQRSIVRVWRLLNRCATAQQRHLGFRVTRLHGDVTDGQ
jgi:hypothetical protein